MEGTIRRYKLAAHPFPQDERAVLLASGVQTSWLFLADGQRYLTAFPE